MSKAFESMAQGLKEAVALTEGQPVPAKTHRPDEVNVAELRHSLGLTAMEFGAKLRIRVGTLRHWERGDRKPHGPAFGFATCSGEGARGGVAGLRCQVSRKMLESGHPPGDWDRLLDEARVEANRLQQVAAQAATATS